MPARQLVKLRNPTVCSYAGMTKLSFTKCLFVPAGARLGAIQVV